MTFTGKYRVKSVRSPLTRKAVIVILRPDGEFLLCGLVRTFAEAHRAVAEDIRRNREIHTGIPRELVYTPNT